MPRKNLTAGVIFLSSFLLFIIQPIFGKKILPIFGGSASTWNILLLFFTTVLFFGYLYSFLTNKISARIEYKIHLFVIFLSLTTVFLNYILGIELLPLKTDGGLGPYPPIQILAFAFFALGAPFFLLSTTTSLLSRWEARSETTKNPYNLYATSNTGSLLGLLSYPFLVEPFFSLKTQGVLWSAIFVFFTLATFYITLRAQRGFSLEKKGQKGKSETNFSDYAKWLALSFLGNFTLFTSTAQIAQSLPPVPLLWILPLSIFLISFVISFSKFNWYSRNLHGALLMGSLFGVAFVARSTIPQDFIPSLLIILFNLFLTNLVAGRELYIIRPSSKLLPNYYLALSLGGALAATISALIIPFVFTNLFEIPINIILGTALCFYVLLGSKRGKIFKFLIFFVLITFSTAIIFMLKDFFISPKSKGIKTLEAVRNFYGIVKVEEFFDGKNEVRNLVNGTTEHGKQILGETNESEPTSYYSRSTGIGKIIEENPQRLSGKPLKFGVVGLGVGTLAAYCHTNDRITFYEINPEIIRVSREYFSFLSHCEKSGGNIQIVQGDARKSLEKESRELSEDKFDILVIDAFTDDTIPTHLLTKEALDLYLERVSNNGVIAFHISNKYLDLSLVLDNLAEELDLYTFRANNQEASWYGVSKSEQKTPELFVKTDPERLKKVADIWTDDFSNLLKVIY